MSSRIWRLGRLSISWPSFKMPNCYRDSVREADLGGIRCSGHALVDSKN